LEDYLTTVKTYQRIVNTLFLDMSQQNHPNYSLYATKIQCYPTKNTVFTQFTFPKLFPSISENRLKRHGEDTFADRHGAFRALCLECAKQPSGGSYDA
jgi:hypothetical protein